MTPPTPPTTPPPTAPPVPVEEEAARRDAIKQTYFGLRYGMVVLAFMLYVAVVIQWVGLDCSQGSISAYYFTPVRPILIAALASIGVGLIVYRGNGPSENRMLDIAGFMAVVVALVPTRRPTSATSCNATDHLLSPDTAALVTPETARRIEAEYIARLEDDILRAIGNSFVALVAAALLAIMLGWFITWLAPSTKPAFDRGRAVCAGAWLIALLVVGLAMYHFLDHATFRLIAHPIAAGTFFTLVLRVMWSNGRDQNTPAGYRVFYKATVVATVIAIVVFLALYAVVVDFLFWVETAGVVGFIAFWLAQSLELGGRTARVGSAGLGGD